MIYFISGHRDITEAEFQQEYARKILLLAYKDTDVNFVVGDCIGVDATAQTLLSDLVSRGVIPYSHVKVYHMFTAPRHNVGSFRTVGGFKSDDERDSAMTNASDEDIAWVRPGREGSGTHKNILRRTS